MDFTEGVIFGVVLTIVLLLVTEPQAPNTSLHPRQTHPVRHIFK